MIRKMASGLLISLNILCGLNAEQRPEKPNILLILTDDLGWQDVKCYDIDEPSPMETPYIDALAKKGVKFCEPTPLPQPAPQRDV